MDREKLEQILLDCANDDLSIEEAIDQIEELALETYIFHD